MKQFLIGSKAFFSGFEDFIPMDTDYLVIYDNPDFEVTKSYMDGDIHYVCWENYSKEKLIQVHHQVYDGKYIQKFLVPEFVEYLGFTIDDLKSLEFLLDRLDEQHGYCRTIYNYYIENNSFTLTQEQLNQAYEVYKMDRKELYYNN
jgi:hypothetical protein